MTATNDGLRQASVRAVSGTALDYGGDWEALFDAAAIAKGAFNGRLLAWINLTMSSSYTEINAAMQGLAAANGAFNFSSMGTFSAGAAPIAFSPLAWRMSQDFSLEWAAAVMTDAPAILASMWVRGNGSDATGGTGQLPAGGRGMFGKTLLGGNGLTGSLDAEHAPGFNITNDNSAGNNGGGVWRGNASDGSGATNQDHSFLGAYSPASGQALNNVGICMTCAVFTNAALGAKQGVMAFNGVPVFTFAEPGIWAGGNMALGTGKFMLNVFQTVGTTLLGADFEAAEVWVKRLTDLSGVVTGTGSGAAFVPSLLKKFYDPAVGMTDLLTDGTGPGLGAPEIYLSVRPAGDPQVDPLTNRGTLTNPTRSAYSGITNNTLRAPFRASLNPGEIGTQPYLAWTTPVRNVTAIADSGSGAQSYTFEENFGQEIRQGDKIYAVFHGAYVGGAPTAFSCASPNGAWTKLVEKTFSLGYAVIFERDATLADVTANGIVWASAVRPTISWTSGGGFGGGGDAKAYCLVVRRATPSTTPMTSTAATPSTGTINSGVGYVTPSLTVPAGPGVLLDFIFTFGVNFEANITGIATGMQLWFKVPGKKGDASFVGCDPVIFDQRTAYLTPTATGTRTYATDATGAGNAYSGFAVSVI